MGEIVKPELLHLQVYQILKKSIMDGERKPSERIVESQIAKQLGISRSYISRIEKRALEKLRVRFEE